MMGRIGHPTRLACNVLKLPFWNSEQQIFSSILIQLTSVTFLIRQSCYRLLEAS